MASLVDAGDLATALATYREKPLRGRSCRHIDLHNLQPEEVRVLRAVSEVKSLRKSLRKSFQVSS